jgi:predicted nucleotidyltransferase
MADLDLIAQLSRTLGEEWPAVSKARAATSERRRALEGALGKYTSEDTSMVVFGSLGRSEITSGSDLDWILLVDGFASPEHIDASLAIEQHLQSADVKGPGAEATFGGLVFSHDLIHYIGGEDDTNANLTRRMLLLLESVPVGREDAYSRTINNVLSRYIVEDFGWMHARNPMNVPRFLQNDMARYWRTLAVDFAYKRRQRAGKGWALRTAKLRLSRKLTYAAGLLMCFSCALDPEIRATVPSEAEPAAAHRVVAHLSAYVRKTPLEIIAAFVLANERLTPAARILLRAYDSFLALLDDDGRRDRLNSLEQDEIAGDEVYQAVRHLGHQFQSALDEIFLSQDTSPELFDLTKKYGVF